MTPATVSRVSKGRPKEIVRLSEETVAALVERAEAEGVSKSDIMRRAIEKELGTEASSISRDQVEAYRKKLTEENLDRSPSASVAWLKSELDATFGARTETEVETP